ncbi:alpha-mannosidase [Leifsonia shinshuensis]|uniref:Alpha-mannosidase n=1 Tax=Leifsonia shinshuensis TaxID=150026 RepID=A0A7G6YAR7_9MICO|nr:glycoside hydrolase family 38 C-terminal domain-containing protein [Leifsonia shinshuensis]QNE35582.1 alpha-mannosidase [Leifsonia shinshuensis]
MHDDIPLTTGRARRVLDERILPAVHSETAPVEIAWNVLPGEPIPPAEGLALDYTPYEVGTPWGRAWGTTWFRLTGAVPAAWAGRRVEAVIDLGFDKNMPGFQCEGLVYRADGSPVKSINPRNQWVLVAESAEGDEEVELFIEAASNPVLLDYHPFLPTQEGDILTSSAKPLYTTRRIELAVFEAEVHALALDIEVLLELQQELPDGPRKMRILQALDDALDALDLQRIPETAPDARAPLAGVLASPAEESAHRISAVGHAHIDSAWLWPVRETVRKVARTTSTMTELIDQTDDFLYGMSSAQQYAWVKEHRPEVWERITAAVAAGRFLPLGGMWVESDTVMPTGESIVRQFSQGQRFFREQFGIAPKGAWLPDSFGYSPALPQLMRRAGFEWFFTQKISWNQVNKFPHHTFLWEGIDGSQLFSHFPPMDTYNSQLSGSEVARASRQFRENRHATGSIAPVGWGDGGGGTTREMTGKAARLANLEGSARVAWEHPDAFFERARAELPNPPVWVGELYLELHRATLTSQHRTKQGNRRTEHLLVEAELWSATAAVRAGLPYPYEQLDRLWQQVLLLQFHDILPGTSIAWVHREAVATYAAVAAELEELIASALAALAGSGDEELVANPAATALGALQAHAIAPAERSAAEPVWFDQGPEGFRLRNGVVSVVVGHDGLVTSAVDLATGREAIAPGAEANLLQLHQDFPNMWDAWDVDRFYRNRVEDLREVDSIEGGIGEDGVARVIVKRSFSTSTVTQTLSLAAGSRTLEFEQSTDWHETEKFLKVAFPLDVRAEHTIAETQFGAHKRVTHTNTSWEAAKFETSMHRFVLVEEPGFGVALVNDSSYGYDTERSVRDGEVTTTLRLSLLRAPRFPDPETDQGVQTHRYGLVIGTSVAGATAAGVLMNQNARTIRGAHAVSPLVSVEGGAVVSSVKLADDRSGDLIVRVYEPEGRRATARLRVDAPVGAARTATLLEEQLPGEPAADAGSVELTLSPFEVRTLRFAVR